MEEKNMGETDTRTDTTLKPALEEKQGAATEEDHLFHPLQLSETKEETVKHNETEAAVSETEKKLEEVLNGITKEAAELSEFMNEENKLMSEVCTFLKQILERIHVSVHIPQTELCLGKEIKEAMLDHDGCLTLVDVKGAKKTSFLAEYPPETVMTVLYVVIPELVQTIRLRKKNVTSRVSFLQKVKKELKGAMEIIVGNDTAKVADQK